MAKAHGWNGSGTPLRSEWLLDDLELRPPRGLFGGWRLFGRLRAAILAGEHHALAALARIDAEHRGDRHLHVVHDACEARIELDRVAEGRKRFRGVLAGVEGDAIGIDLEGEDSTAMIPFEWIVDAKLILTDALMKRGADERAARLSAEADQDTPE